jgi:hypothetical protein
MDKDKPKLTRALAESDAPGFMARINSLLDEKSISYVTSQTKQLPLFMTAELPSNASMKDKLELNKNRDAFKGSLIKSHSAILSELGNDLKLEVAAKSREALSGGDAWQLYHTIVNCVRIVTQTQLEEARSKFNHIAQAKGETTIDYLGRFVQAKAQLDFIDPTRRDPELARAIEERDCNILVEGLDKTPEGGNMNFHQNFRTQAELADDVSNKFKGLKNAFETLQQALNTTTQTTQTEPTTTSTTNGNTVLADALNAAANALSTTTTSKLTVEQMIERIKHYWYQDRSNLEKLKSKSEQKQTGATGYMTTRDNGRPGRRNKKGFYRKGYRQTDDKDEGKKDGRGKGSFFKHKRQRLDSNADKQNSKSNESQASNKHCEICHGLNKPKYVISSHSTKDCNTIKRLKGEQEDRNGPTNNRNKKAAGAYQAAIPTVQASTLVRELT